MKTKLIQLFIILLGCTSMMAQSSNKESVAVIQIDSKGFTLDPAQMGDIARVELDKLNLFEVIDKYDVAYLIEKNNLTIENCFGKLCAVEVGQTIQSDKMLTGSVEYYGQIIIVSLRLIDVGTASIEKSRVVEFIKNRAQVQAMINMTLRQMFDLPVDEDLANKLTKPFDFENAINFPEATKINLNGPRMGLVLFTGQNADVLKSPRDEGGYDAMPVMFQFGYQFEVSYINEGNFQALFEFIPLVSGLDQGLFIPSLTILNGLRSSRNGWEFAFGPTFSVTNKSQGYYDESGKWHLRGHWDRELGDNPHSIVNRIDSRGLPEVSTGFVFGVGKTFKSGRLNIPLNAFFIPGKNGNHRVGLSFGFNATSMKSKSRLSQK